MENTNRLIEAYKKLAKEKGTLPVSRKEIAEAAGLDIIAFEATYQSLELFQEAVWLAYLRSALETLENSEEYLQYSVREKLLAFYYTFFEILDKDGAFAKMFRSKLGVWNYNPTFLTGFKHGFLIFIGELITEGIESNEIAERMMLGDEYGGWHWPQMLFLLNKWVEDSSDDHQISDQAIEKAVNLGFDIMGRNLFDSAFDLAKFVVTGH